MSLHVARRRRKSLTFSGELFRTGGGSLFGSSCTFYFFIRIHLQFGFEHAPDPGLETSSRFGARMLSPRFLLAGCQGVGACDCPAFVACFFFCLFLLLLLFSVVIVCITFLRLTLSSEFEQVHICKFSMFCFRHVVDCGRVVFIEVSMRSTSFHFERMLQDLPDVGRRVLHLRR